MHQHADNCSFECNNPHCTERDKIYKTLIWNQIFICTSIKCIWENVHEKEYELDALILQAHKTDTNKEAVHSHSNDSDVSTATASLNKYHLHGSN